MLWACHDCLGFYLLFTRSHCPSRFCLLCQAKGRQRELCVMTAPLLQVNSPYLINTNCICLTEIFSPLLIICLLPAFVKGNERKTKNRKDMNKQRYSFIRWYIHSLCKNNLSIICIHMCQYKKIWHDHKNNLKKKKNN